MAIKRYTGTNEHVPSSNIANFFEANKAGTFLANATIEYIENPDAEESVTKALKISLNGVSFFMKFSTGYQATQGKLTQAYITNGSSKRGWVFNAGTSQAVYYTFRDGDILFCTNGVIFCPRFYHIENSTTTARSVYALTHDGNGNLAMISGTPDGSTSTFTDGFTISTGYKFFTMTSDVNTISQVPARNFQATVLAPMVLTEAGNVNVSEFAFASVMTQYESNMDTLTAVTLNNADYITNGRWYIKD